MVANDHSGPVPIPGLGGPQITIPSGTTVCTYVVNWDPPPNVSGLAAGQIDFGLPILAVTTTGPGAFSSQFDVPGVVYGSIISPLFTNDFLRSNGSVLDVDLRVATGAIDQFRVITSC